MVIWLSNQIGTTTANIITSFVFCVITCIAIAMLILFLSRLKKKRLSIHRNKRPPRLTLCETIVIDRTRRLVLVRCDNKEHLLLIGGLTDIVVEANINSTSLIKKEDTQPTLSIKETNLSNMSTEQRSLNKREHAQSNNTASFMKQHVEDSAITAEIEGRHEPSLFIPPQNK
ncbi:flagellar biosynthetic protein FliO [Bartonella sp. MM73XJBT]|uniref:flagellar biosynthetic protein FliO n=1 Tax=Bartonella sp. MM73XJBT TaxID=3019095 RepID=UPI0023625D36|nr:flagellar biosynthetic protein FliO [Bartonella sp. MM73XJBT]